MFPVRVQLLLLLFCHGSLGSQVGNEIVGGETAKTKWPSMVGIFIKPNPKAEAMFKCGGTLIHKNWVLTAAHCVQCIDDKAIEVHVGMKTKNDTNSKIYTVKFSKQHEAYAHWIQKNDVALLKLSAPVEKIDFVKLGDVPPSKKAYNICYAVGWGNIQEKVPLPDNKPLQQVKVPLVTNKDCKNVYKESQAEFDESVFCAGFTNSGHNLKGTCQGDSGGPLMCNHKNSWVQVGIVNQAEGCGEKPTVFASVHYYLTWINNNAK